MEKLRKILASIVKIQQYLLANYKDCLDFKFILQTIGDALSASYASIFILEGRLDKIPPPYKVPLAKWGETENLGRIVQQLASHYAQLLNDQIVLIEDQILILPIVVDCTLWGALVLVCEQWQQETIEILPTLTFSIAKDITRRSRELDNTKVLEREIELFAISRRFSQSLKTNQILATAAEEVRLYSGCDRVLIYRMGGAKGSQLLYQSGREGVQPDQTPINLANFVGETLRPRIVDDVDRAVISPAILKLFHKAKIKAFLSVPITIDTELWGWLVLHICDRAYYWNSKEVYAIKHLAEQLGVALNQADLYETTLRQQQQDHVLHQVANFIRHHADRDINATLRGVGEILCQLCGIDSVDFWYYDRGTEAWVNPVCYSCVNQESVTHTRISPLKLEPVPWECGQILGFPLVMRSEIWGVMEITPAPGTLPDRDLLELIANQLVLAIHRLELYNHSRMQNLREQALNRLMRRILLEDSLNDFFTTALMELHQHLKTDRIYVGRCLSKNRWQLEWGYRGKENEIKKLTFELGEVRPDIAEALSRGEIIHIDYPHQLVPQFNLVAGALYLPLQFQNQVWGCLVIVRRKKHWLIEELQLAEGLADIIAIAIYQQNLKELEQAQRQELSIQNLHLEAALQAAETARAAQNRFLANMSHEIRTPMNGVIGMAELLAETPLTTQQSQFVDTIGICARNLLSLINDILDLSKLEAGETQLEALPFRIHTCIEEACHLIAVKCHQKNIEVFPWLDPNLPQEVEGDPTKLQQVLNNLASNAAKFTDRGIINIKAEVLIQQEEEVTVCFTVQDTGIGIRDQDLGRLFKPFQQVDASTTRRFGGTGLGLSICRQLVELMGGNISVQSEFGKGSAFIFTVPLRVVNQQSSPPQNLNGMKILLVSSQQLTVNVIESYVKPWNADMDWVRDGTFALERLRSCGYDRVLLDMQMEPINGEMLAQYIRLDRQLAHLKLVLMTLSNTQISDINLFDHILIKPITSDRLLQCLNLDRSQNQQAEPLFDSTIKVLLVEDNIVNQTLATNQLKKLGLTFDLAKNGAEAVQLAQVNQYNLILMDCQMPVMDGFTASQEIRRLGKNLPIIAMTASALESDREACLASGMNDFVSKPVTKNKLAQVIQQWLATDTSTSSLPSP